MAGDLYIPPSPPLRFYDVHAAWAISQGGGRGRRGAAGCGWDGPDRGSITTNRGRRPINLPPGASSGCLGATFV